MILHEVEVESEGARRLGSATEASFRAHGGSYGLRAKRGEPTSADSWLHRATEAFDSRDCAGMKPPSAILGHATGLVRIEGVRSVQLRESGL